MIERVFDLELIKSVITDDSVYSGCTDDGSPQPSEYTPADPNAILYLADVFDAEVTALFVLVPQNSATLEVHTCIKKKHRGRRAVLSAKSMLIWVFSNTDAEKVITNIPFYNRPAKSFALMSGLSVEGINRMSIMKNGILYNQWFMGITKGEVCQQQQ